jgi:hypothetical protein
MEFPVKHMTLTHRQTLTNRMLGRRRPVTEANLGVLDASVGNFYKVPLPVNQNTVTVPLTSHRSSNSKASRSTRKSSNRTLSPLPSNILKSSNNPSTLRSLERERKAELCKLLKAIEGPFDRNDGRNIVILRAIKFLTHAIERRFPNKLFKAPYGYYQKISSYIIQTVFDEDKDLDIEYLKDLATHLGLYKKCRITRRK